MDDFCKGYNKGYWDGVDETNAAWKRRMGALERVANAAIMDAQLSRTPTQSVSEILDEILGPKGQS